MSVIPTSLKTSGCIALASGNGHNQSYPKRATVIHSIVSYLLPELCNIIAEYWVKEPCTFHDLYSSDKNRNNWLNRIVRELNLGSEGVHEFMSALLYGKGWFSFTDRTENEMGIRHTIDLTTCGSQYDLFPNDTESNSIYSVNPWEVASWPWYDQVIPGFGYSTFISRQEGYFIACYPALRSDMEKRGHLNSLTLRFEVFDWNEKSVTWLQVEAPNVPCRLPMNLMAKDFEAQEDESVVADVLDGIVTQIEKSEKSSCPRLIVTEVD